jgi:hypothetical protein
VKDLSLAFQEAGTSPTNGPTYYGAEVNYIPSPEPVSMSLLATGAAGLLIRWRPKT